MQRGHELVRFFWRMEIDMSEEPRVPERPAGTTIRDYRPGEDDPRSHAMRKSPSRSTGSSRRARSTSG